MDTNKNIFDLTPTIDTSDIDNTPRWNTTPDVDFDGDFLPSNIIFKPRDEWFFPDAPFPNHNIKDGVFFSRWDSIGYDEKPTEKPAAITMRMWNQPTYFFMTNEEIEARIRAGYTLINTWIISDGTFKEKLINWMGCQYIILDFDCSEYTVESLLEHLKAFSIYPFLIHYSFSGMKPLDDDGKPNKKYMNSFHVLIKLSSPITDRDTYKTLLKNIINTVGAGADRQCTNLARIWYSSTDDCIAYRDYDAITFTDNLISYVNTYRVIDEEMSVAQRKSSNLVVHSNYDFSKNIQYVIGLDNGLFTLNTNLMCKTSTSAIVYIYSQCSDFTTTKQELSENSRKLIIWNTDSSEVIGLQDEETDMHIGEGIFFQIAHTKTEANRIGNRRTKRRAQGKVYNFELNESKLMMKSQRYRLEDLEENIINTCQLYRDFIGGEINIKHSGMRLLMGSFQHMIGIKSNDSILYDRIENSGLSYEQKAKARAYLTCGYIVPMTCSNGQCPYLNTDKCNAGAITTPLSRCFPTSSYRGIQGLDNPTKPSTDLDTTREMIKNTFGLIHNRQDVYNLIKNGTGGGKTKNAIDYFKQLVPDRDEIVMYAVTTHQLIQSLVDEYNMDEYSLVQHERPDINYTDNDLHILRKSDSGIRDDETDNMWDIISDGKTCFEKDIIQKYRQSISDILSLRTSRKLLVTHKMAMNIISLYKNKYKMKCIWDEDIIPELQHTEKIHIDILDRIESYNGNLTPSIKEWMYQLRYIGNSPALIKYDKEVERYIRNIAIHDETMIPVYFFTQKDTFAISTNGGYIMGMKHDVLEGKDGDIHIFLTATPHIPFYEELFSDIKIYDIPDASHNRVYIDDTNTLSEASIDGLSKKHNDPWYLVTLIRSVYDKLGLDGIIIPKKYREYIEKNYPEITILYTFGNEQGFNAPSHIHKMGVFGTPNPPSQVVPLTFASIYRKEYEVEDVQQRQVSWGDYIYYATTFEDGPMQDYHQHMVRSKLQQAAGRLRDGDVYMFCGTPIFGAEALVY